MKRSFLIFTGLLCMTGPAVHAADFTVSNSAELQDALTQAQANGEADTIHVTAGEYKISQNGGQTFSYNGLSENFPLTIEGEGAASTILDGESQYGLLSILTTDLSAPVNDGNAFITVKNIGFKNGKDLVVGNPGSIGPGGLLILTNLASINIENNLFENNQGFSGGGAAVLSQAGNFSCSENRFINNKVSSISGDSAAGGAAYIFAGGTKHEIVRNIVQGNQAIGTDATGGGMIFALLNPNGSVLVEGNVIVKNSAEDQIGGLGLVGGVEVNVLNNTIAGNSIKGNATDSTGGLAIGVVYDAEKINLANNIIRGNSTPANQFEDNDLLIINSAPNSMNPVSVVLSNNNFSEANFICELDPNCVIDVADSNNIDEDPLFADADAGNFHITEGSPCIDKGSELFSNLVGEVDFDGDPRVLGDAIDIGADEFSRCGDSVLSTGAGEICDDGNTIDGDGCSSVCLTENADVSAGGSGCALNPNSHLPMSLTWMGLLFGMALLACRSLVSRQ